MSRNSYFAGSRALGSWIGHSARRGGTWAAGVIASLVLLLGVPAHAAQTEPGAAVGAGLGLAHVAVLDLVMLVDESGSETPQKVAEEKATAATIAQSTLNQDSRVTVIGFGGVNHVVPNQNPVSVVCQPTIASGARNLSYLSSCVNGLHTRSEAEGDDTDYAAALQEAMNYLAPASTATPPSPGGATKIILLMTDGAVDVSRNTQQYGADWQLGEQTAIGQQLQLAHQDGVQVWPLGFGNDVGGSGVSGITEAQALAYLNDMAARGAPAVCEGRRTADQPHATWVNDITDAINQLNLLYADAACLGTNRTHTVLPGGQSRTLAVSIPAIASAAAISVRPGNSDVTVAFTRPDGTPWTDSSAISGADGNSPVEVLHLNDISSADVGNWHIKLTAPPGLASQLVSATVFWQGAVRAIVTATPNVNPGNLVSVTLSVLGPNGPISDASTLQSLLVGVTATGDGLSGPTQVPVTGMSGPGGAGTYTGTFTAPRQRGSLTITGTAVGYGLNATQVPATVTVGMATAFTATPKLPLTTHVQAGDSIPGQVIFTNSTGTAKQVRLVLTASGADAAIRPAGAIVVSSGNPPSVPFTIAIGRDSPAGTAVLIVQAVDAQTGQPYDSARLEIMVTRPPGFLAKYLWYLVGGAIAIVLLIALILWRRAVRRAERDVQDLAVTLRRGGEQKGRELPAEPKWSDVFRFIVVDEATPDPHLDYPPRGWTGAIYQVRRSRRGLVTLMAPTRPKPYEDVEVNGPGVLLESGLELSFRDRRRRHVPRARTGGSGAGISAVPSAPIAPHSSGYDTFGATQSAPSAPPPPNGATPHVPPAPQQESQKDPWL